MNRLFAMSYFSVFIFTYFVVVSSTSSRSIEAQGLVLKLIHPAKVSELFTTKDSNTDVIQGKLTPDVTGFYVNMSIGEPSIWQMVVIDTGSSETWVQCLPCVHCFSQLNPYYDPSKSSTFSKVSADSPACKYPPKLISSINYGSPACTYDIHYADNSSTRGELCKEKLTFPTSDEGLKAIPNLMFGCGHENYGVGFKNGVLGLGASPISLVSQLGNNKFSHCLGNLSDPNYEFNHLIIGGGAIFEGDAIPFVIHEGKYYLPLEGIVFGNDKRLDIDPSIFKLSPFGRGGVIIDSGTFLTYLVRRAYNALSDEVQSSIGGRLPKVNVPDMDLCYKGVMSRDLEGFPVVSFQFAGTLIEIDYEGLFFQQTNDIFCFAMAPVDDYEISVIGITFQQYFNIGYDLDKMTLYFQRIACELLDN